MARVDNLSNFLSDVADAIRTKKGSEELIAAADFDTEIDNLPSGGGIEAPFNDVNFYDYDGFRAYSYTAQEFLALEEMPANPEHDGLTAQGWNWSLADAKTEVSRSGMLDIGQHYVTNDGATRIYIDVPYDGFDPYMQFSGNGPWKINWGDGNIEDVGTSQTSQTINTGHTYLSAGKYVISILCLAENNPSLTIVGSQYTGSRLLYANDTSITAEYTKNTTYHSAITKIECGGEYVYISDYGLTDLRCLSTISTNTTFNFGANSLRNCYSLKCLILSAYSGGGFPFTFNLRNICLGKNSGATTSASIRTHRALESILIHGTFSGNNTQFKLTIDDCSALKRISLPESVTSTSGSNFQQCYALRSVYLPSTLTSLGASSFAGCYSLAHINLPASLTSIGQSCFNSCVSLCEVVIPNNVTSIGNSVFNNCYGLRKVKMSKNIPTIGSNVFANCSRVEYYDFSEYETIPTLSSTAAFTGISAECKIIVPDDLYEDWIAAANWSTYADNIISKSDWDALQNA